MDNNLRNIEIEFTYTPQLVAAASQYLYKSLFFGKRSMLILAGVVIIFVLTQLDFKSGPHLSDFETLLGPAFGLLLVYMLIPWFSKRQVSKQIGGKQFKWLITENDIHITADKYETNLKWSYFKTFIVCNKVLLIKAEGNTVNAIPLEAFKNNDWPLMQTWLSKNLKQE